jgi:glycosyltransferase involved in cell wall biosynthesis
VKPRLLVDVTQYATWPARSGIQRVLGNLAAHWEGHRVTAHFGFLEEGTFVVGPLRPLGEHVRDSFASGRAPEPREVLPRLAESSVAAEAIGSAFEGYLLPEPTLDRGSLSVLERLLRSFRASTFLLYFDPLPMTRPELFPHRADASLVVTRYQLLATRADNVAFISDTVRREFEARLARREVPNALVVHPGVGPSSKPDGHAARRFAMVGTVEPRKGHRIVLEAFEGAWEEGLDYDLVLLGAPGWEMDDLLERLEAHARSGRIIWYEHPGDDTILRVIESCAGLLFPSEAEGYGLPPLEALARGCPVVVSARLPSIQTLPPAGQIRLRDVTAESVRHALDALADPRRNAELRRSIDALSLPSWAQFALDVEEWVSESITAASSPVAA